MWSLASVRAGRTVASMKISIRHSQRGAERAAAVRVVRQDGDAARMRRQRCELRELELVCERAWRGRVQDPTLRQPDVLAGRPRLIIDADPEPFHDVARELVPGEPWFVLAVAVLSAVSGLALVRKPRRRRRRHEQAVI